MSEQVEVKSVKVEKTEKKDKASQMKKLDSEALKLLSTLKEKANKKQFGRKVRDSEIVLVGLKLVGAEEIKRLQEGTLTEQDRLKIAHEEFQRKHGRLSLDAFVGKLLRGEIRVADQNPC